MQIQTESSFQILCVLILSQIDLEARADLGLVPTERYDSSFNFHNKTTFLKRSSFLLLFSKIIILPASNHIKRLIDCIQPSDSSDKSTKPLPLLQTLNKSTKGSLDGKTERFIFDYNGTREYNETCLGDTYKKDLIKRLYDAICMTYEEKIKFLDMLSCNATQNLECRQVGVEAEREFAEQATPIMRCLCPDFSKSQAYLSDSSKGYFDNTTKRCVLKAGQLCTINPKPLDARLVWNDFDYNENGDNNTEGIDVIDLRPIMTNPYPCVNHAFCYNEADKSELRIPAVSRNRCVCKAGFFSGTDRECHEGRDPPSTQGLILAIIMYFIAVGTFLSLLMF